MISPVNAPSDLGKYSQSSQMSMAPNMPGIQTGNMFIDMMMSMLMGGTGVAPRPIKGQSILESYQSRERSQQYLQIMRESMATSPMFNKLGGMGGGIASIASIMSGGPDGLINNPIMRALNGGNPVQEQMTTMAKLNGFTSTMGLGRFGSASPTTARNYADALTKTSFDTKVIGDRDVNDVKKQKSSDVMDYISKDPSRQERFRDFITKDKEGKETFDVDKFEAQRTATGNFTRNMKKQLTSVAAEEFSKVMKETDAISQIRGKVGTVMRVAARMEDTRGYESQDLTKSMFTAMDAGLFSGGKFEQEYLNNAKIKGISPTDKGRDEYTASKYFKNTPKVLNAVSDLTGAKDANEAMGHLNDLLGNSTLNLGNDNDSRYAEDLMRRFKASARSAGISIDAVMGILNGTKALAAQHPELQYMGGIGAMETTIKTVQQTQALSAAMGSGAVRGEGGQAAFMAQQQDISVKNKVEPIALQAKGMYSFINDSDFTEEQKKKANAALEKHLKDPNLDPSLIGWGTFANQELNPILHHSSQEMIRAMLNPGAQARGEEMISQGKVQGKDLSWLDDSAETATTGAFKRRALLEINLVQQSKNAKTDANGRKLTAQQVYDERFEGTINSVLEAGGSESEALNKAFGAAGIKGASAEGMVNNPTNPFSQDSKARLFKQISMHGDKYKATHQAIVNATNTQAADESRYAKQFAKYNNNASALAVLGAEFMSGRMGQGTKALTDLLITPEGKQRSDEMLKGIGEMNREQSDSATTDAYYQIHGGAANLTEEQIRKNLATEGRGDAADQIINQRNAYTEANKDGGFDKETAKFVDQLGSKGATLDQVMNSMKGNNEKDQRKYFSEQSVFKGTNISFNEAKKYIGQLQSTGIVGDDTLAKYGGNKFNRETSRQMISTQGMGINVDMMSSEELKELEKTESGNIDATMNELDRTHIGQDPKVDVEGRKEAAKIRDAIKSMGAAKYEGREVKSYDGGKVADDLRNGKLDPHMKSLLKKYGSQYVSVDDKGNIVDMDRKSFEKDLKEDFHRVDPEIRAEMEKHSEYAKFGKGGEYSGYDIEKIADYKDKLGDDLQEGLSPYKDKDGKIDTAKLEKDLKTNMVSKSTVQQLAEKKFATLDKEGNFSKLDKKALEQAASSDSSMNILRNSSIGAQIKDLQEHKEVIRAKQEELTKPLKDAADKQTEALKDFSSMLGDNSTALVSALKSVVDALTGASK